VLSVLTTTPPADDQTLVASTIDELVALKELGCRLVTGAADRLRQPLAGAHSIEIDAPARWLDAGWLMLTTGSLLGLRSAEEQGALIAELDDCSIAGIAFGTGVNYDQIPPALVEAAQERGFPILEVPAETPFRDVIAAVQRGAAHAEVWRANRISAMQSYLVDALTEEEPASVVVRRLASLTDTTVVLMRRGGMIECASGPVPTGVDVDALEVRDGTTLIPLDVDGHDVIAVSVDTAPTAFPTWLVLVSLPRQELHAFARPAARAAAPILHAVAQLETAQHRRDASTRRAIFDSLVAGDDRHEIRRGALQAAACGVDFADGVNALVILDAHGRPVCDDATFERFDARLAEAGVAFVGGLKDGAVAGLVCTRNSGDLAALAEEVGMKTVLGIGRTVMDPEYACQSLADAFVAANACSRRPKTAMLRYEDLDLITTCVNELPLDRLEPKIEQLVNRLRENPQLYETVIRYLEHNLHIGRTARALNLHPNSVRYRLARAEELIGAPLRAPSTIVGLHLVLTQQRQSQQLAPGASALNGAAQPQP